jgi:hypothetical protein
MPRRVILTLLLLFLPVLWLAAAVLAVAACRAASRADRRAIARRTAGADRQGARLGESPAGYSTPVYGLVVNQGV